MINRILTFGCAAMALLPAAVISQNVPTRSLSEPEAVSAEGFTKISGLAELRDGRVVLIDELDRLVRVLDRTLSNVTQVGRQGSGPGEYQAPHRLLPLPGGRYAIDDAPNARMALIGPDGALVGFLDRFGAPPGTPLPAIKLPPTFADGRGYFYAQAGITAASRDGRGPPATSAPLLRWRGGAITRDTVALIPVPAAERLAPAGPGRIAVRAPSGPFSTRPQWAVAANGSVAIVHPDPYRVEIVAADGRRRMGPTVKFAQIRITEAEKASWREEAAAPRVTVVGTRDGRRSVQARSWPVQEPAQWPRYMPPFLYDALQYAPDGRLWVQRATAAGSPGLYDIFDASGRLVERVTIPPRSRVVAFGKATLYVVRKDDVDLEYVERYR